MTQKVLGVLVAVALLAASSPAHAANKEHQQLMADLRMLQEQSQLLQNLLGTLNDALVKVNTRLDQQAEASRKAMADQKLVIDNLQNDVRVIREQADTTRLLWRRVFEAPEDADAHARLARGHARAQVRQA